MFIYLKNTITLVSYDLFGRVSGFSVLTPPFLDEKDTDLALFDVLLKVGSLLKFVEVEFNPVCWLSSL